MSTNIVQAETDRLTKQKASIDDALDDKRRLLNLNDAYRKRTTSYTYIVMGITAAALCMIGISFLPIPSVFTNILYVFIIMGVFILIVYRYDEIAKRNKLDYDELDLPSMGTGAGNVSAETAAENKAAAQDAGKLSDVVTSGSTGSCANEACCSSGTTWNAAKGKCESQSAFTTLDEAYSAGEIISPYIYNSPSMIPGLNAYTPLAGISYTSL